MAKKKEGADQPRPYNPLDKIKLGESVANALLARPLLVFPPEPFEGAGVYAIYYAGPFKPYQSISGMNEDGEIDRPIYIGKAVPRGARKGHLDLDSGVGDSLYQRLREHAESVDQVQLGRSNFRCKYLVVDDIWIPLGESMMIQRYRPLWNVLLDGFGNHDPGGRRLTAITSRWDTVHPGRPWVVKRHLQPNPKSPTVWLNEIETYLRTGQSTDLVMEEAVEYSTDGDLE